MMRTLTLLLNVLTLFALLLTALLLFAKKESAPEYIWIYGRD